MQFIYCQFGEFDKKADITIDGDLVPEYWDCGNRPCPADGLLCTLPKAVNGVLTIREAQLIREVSADQSSKMVADKFHRSKLTIDTQMRTIRHKLNCYTKAGVCAFAGQHNLT
jgi:DNA-binding NarL/FixJ family response regulator